MNRVNEILSELGLSKVKLAKYLGVSRQMLYNYLGMKSINEWPKEKSTKFLGLLGVKDEKEIESIELDSDYILAVEAKLADGVKSDQDKDELTTLKGFNKKEQELLSDIFYLLKQKLNLRVHIKMI